jgi:hypothetical protein
MKRRRRSWTTWIAWTGLGVFAVLAGGALLVVAVYSGATRWAGLVERGRLSIQGELAPDCERGAAAGRERLAARLGAARRQGSVERVLCVAEALAAMGDGQGVRDAVRVAEHLAGSDAEARADVRAFREHFAEWVGEPDANATGPTAVEMVLPSGQDRLGLTTRGVAATVTACRVGDPERLSAQPSTSRGDPS